MVDIKIRNESGNSNPEYTTEGSAGMDLRANLDNDVILKPGQRVAIPTGLYIQLPDGFQAEVRPRSGLALKNGITVLNTPGTVDSDYRGEIKVILINLSNEDFVVKNADRIAQLVITKYEKIKWINVNELESTKRADGGFGHSGKE